MLKWSNCIWLTTHSQSDVRSRPFHSDGFGIFNPTAWLLQIDADWCLIWTGVERGVVSVWLSTVGDCIVAVAWGGDDGQLLYELACWPIDALPDPIVYMKDLNIPFMLVKKSWCCLVKLSSISFISACPDCSIRLRRAQNLSHHCSFCYQQIWMQSSLMQSLRWMLGAPQC